MHPIKTQMSSLFQGPRKEDSNMVLAPTWGMVSLQMVELWIFFEKNAYENFWVEVKTS